MGIIWFIVNEFLVLVMFFKNKPIKYAWSYFKKIASKKKWEIFIYWIMKILLGIELPERELACAPIDSSVGKKYLGAMRAGINCAMANRQVLTVLVREAFAQRQSFTTMDFRDMLATSRKYAVPVVDYFDALGLTRRTGNRRSPGPNVAAGAGPVPPAGEEP